jgi:hypothetical protein
VVGRTTFLTPAAFYALLISQKGHVASSQIAPSWSTLIPSCEPKSRSCWPRIPEAVPWMGLQRIC